MSQKLQQAEQRVARKRAEIEKASGQIKQLQEKLVRLQEEEKILEAERATALFTEFGLTFEEAKILLATKGKEGGHHVSSTESGNL